MRHRRCRTQLNRRDRPDASTHTEAQTQAQTHAHQPANGPTTATDSSTRETDGADGRHGGGFLRFFSSVFLRFFFENVADDGWGPRLASSFGLRRLLLRVERELLMHGWEPGDARGTRRMWGNDRSGWGVREKEAGRAQRAERCKRKRAETFKRQRQTRKRGQQ